jgi:hypothetical protein
MASWSRPFKVSSVEAAPAMALPGRLRQLASDDASFVHGVKSCVDGGPDES